MDGSNLLQKSPNLRAGILCVLEMHLNVRETGIVYYYGTKIIREIEKHRKIEAPAWFSQDWDLPVEVSNLRHYPQKLLKAVVSLST